MAEEDELNALSDELERIKETLHTNTIQIRQMVEELKGVLPLMKNPGNFGEKIQEIGFRLTEPQGVRRNASDTNIQGSLPNTLQESKEQDPMERFDGQREDGSLPFSLSHTHRLGSVADNIATRQCHMATYGRPEMVDLASIHGNKPAELVTACCDAKTLVLDSVKSMIQQDEETMELRNNSNILVSPEKDPGKDRAIAAAQRLQEHNDADKKPFSRKSIIEFIAWISAQQGNFCSSQPFVYSNKFLKHWEQLLTLENMRGKMVLLAQDPLWSGTLNSKLEEGLSEEEIEMVLLDAMNNVMVGNDVVRGAVNSKDLEYAIQDFKEGMEVYCSKVEPQALTIETSVCNEVAYLYRNVILAEDFDSVKSVAVRTTLFSKHFVTTWPFIDKDDDTLRFICGLTRSPLDLGVLFSYRDFLVLVIVRKRYKDAKVCSSTIIVQRRNLNMHDVWTSRLNFYCCLSYGPSGDLAESIISKVIQDGALEFIKGYHNNQLLIAFVKTEVRDLFCGVIGDFGHELTRSNYEGGLLVLEMAQVYIKQADFVCEMINKVNGDTSYVRLKEKILEICECDCILGSLNCCFKIKKWP
ncbi:hypothetical protein CDL12_06668 [Handroanthus impetiginosus]|uniref:Uncharacterized protein n=1 Tax=Handroanthus impetiginosus TaxID=429701 RepID=A0A2G9HSY3_9LAMI|nr:hypothetical protein CDL12_06668 [Handroanthus impetiginosus]